MSEQYAIQNLCDVGGKTVWFCAMHGTVSRCPFRWMTCEETDTPDLTQNPDAKTDLEAFRRDTENE